jgi:hypothetical protein
MHRGVRKAATQRAGGPVAGILTEELAVLLVSADRAYVSLHAGGIRDC